MKTMQLIISVLLFFSMISCANDHTEKQNLSTKDSIIATGVVSIDTFKTGKVISPVICKADPSESYALYIPSKRGDEALPILFFFDPHGAGDLPLMKYKVLADIYGFIMVGSNNSKNGNDWPTEERTWDNLFTDAKTRLKINSSRIYVCGFSGGAKVATYMGLNHHEIKAVIANGAGLPGIANTGDLHFSFTAVTGSGDMNMTDLVAINSDLDKTKARHRLIFFNGKHEWAPADAMNIALSGLQLDAMREKIIPADASFISNFSNESKKRIEDLLKMNNYTKAESACLLSVNLLDGLTEDANWFRQKDISIKNDPAYQKQNKEEENLLATEQNLKSFYSQQMQQGDMNYWSKTIAEIQNEAKAQHATGAMYQRLQAYLSLAFYSLSNQLINSNRNKEAGHFVELYKMDDPNNSEAWYFSAILNARNNNASATEKDLLKAVECGLNDVNRIVQQPEFKNLRINLSAITGKMKK